MVQSGENERIIKKLDIQRVRESINTHDDKLALNILKYITLPRHLAHQVADLAGKTSADYDFYGEWGLVAA